LINSVANINYYMNSNYNNILSILDAISNETTKSIYIPSIKRDVQFKGINTGQQKSILKAAVDNPVFQTRFTIAFYEILQENCLEKDILPKLTTIDGAAIALQLRVAAAGSDYTLQQGNRKYKINLQTIVDKFKDINLVESEVLPDNVFVVTVGSPCIAEHYSIEKQLREKTVNDQQVLSAQITDTIGDAFVGEVSKFIKNITVFYNNQEQQTDYASLPFAKRHALLEKIPNSVVQGVLKYMEKYVTIQKDLLTVSGTDIETGEIVNNLIIMVDSTLFIVS
jgi:hypothetical protein